MIASGWGCQAGIVKNEFTGKATLVEHPFTSARKQENLFAGIFFKIFFSALFSAAGKYKLEFDKTQIGIVAKMLQQCLLMKLVKLATVFPTLHCIRPAQPA
jgi:hypothetical protein